MFLIIGNTSCKTSTIRNILNLKQNFLSTQDYKCYHYDNNIIIDTPSLSKYKNFNEIFNQCQKLSFQKITLVILFYTQDIKILQIIKIYNYLKSVNTDFYVYTNFYEWKYSNTSFKTIDRNELKQIITKNIIDNKHKIDKKYLLIGETNVGKSTFINSVISNNIITTNNNKYTTKECLLIQTKINNDCVNLYDTYGLETQNKNKIIAMKNLIKTVNRILIIVDIYNFCHRFNRYIIGIANKYKKNTSIIVTKLDLINSEKKQNIVDYFYQLDIKPFFTSVNNNNEKNLPINIFKKINDLKTIKISKINITNNLKQKVKNLVYAKLINTEENNYILEMLITKTKTKFLPNNIIIKKHIIKEYNLYNFYITINIKQTV